MARTSVPALRRNSVDELQVLALAADVELGGDGRRVLVDDHGDGAHGAAVGELRFDVDGHGALVERAVGRGENDGVAGGVDGAPGEHAGADLVPGRAGDSRGATTRGNEAGQGEVVRRMRLFPDRPFPMPPSMPSTGAPHTTGDANDFGAMPRS